VTNLDGTPFTGTFSVTSASGFNYAVPARCIADFNEDGGIDGADVSAFFAAWESGDSSADANRDGGVDGSDTEAFFAAWEAGGC
jgi:hypothetical protein